MMLMCCGKKEACLAISCRVDLENDIEKTGNMRFDEMSRIFLCLWINL